MKNIKLLLLVVTIILVGLALFARKVEFANPLSDSKTVYVTISASGFNPSDITVKKGQKVIFVNKDKKMHWPASNPHPTHYIYPEFDPKQPIPPGGSWEFVFQKVGTWLYHDHLNPETNGSITVSE